MISVYHLKPKFQALLMPILRFLYKLGITANMITILSILLSLATGIYLFIFPGYWALIIMPLALLLSMALNALDGMMARIYQMQSKKGEILKKDMIVCLRPKLINSISPFEIYKLLGKKLKKNINKHDVITKKCMI